MEPGRLLDAFRKLGCETVFVKRLSSAENDRGQVRLVQGDFVGNFTLPYGEVDDRGNGKHGASIDLVWIDGKGGEYSAPNTNIAYYPPDSRSDRNESRLSGFLTVSGGANPFREAIRARVSGRVLLLGSGGAGEVYAWIGMPDSPVAVFVADQVEGWGERGRPWLEEIPIDRTVGDSSIEGLARSPSWLFLAAGDNLARGSWDGYPDDPASTYVWDSTCPHHADPAAGDLVAIWDKEALLGVSEIDAINTEGDTKEILKCPSCRRGNFKARRRKTPVYRCYGCKTLFDDPFVIEEEVTIYRSRHEASWIHLPGLLNAAELRALCRKPASQQSIRRLRTYDFLEALLARGARDSLALVSSGRPRDGSKGGHRVTKVRVRVGQGEFRNRLLDRYGNTCAVLGGQPAEVLEACHLYSYADVGRHHEEGGLLLRRDVHRLFDRGLLTVNPADLTLVADDELAAFPEYAKLTGSRLTVEPSDEQRAWLKKHWDQHRPDGREERDA